ncbi:Ribosomal protein L27 [Spironucleus salmonicida]|uniref:Ribosomal protein L27 n=1 Tax=Spironucleus salmonicida TaxID=348837 RepID=V6LKL6_9EUKA|nr:Ribosomal protein L27 [Spironucleus salmonicida]|eukprot:EST44271.1 Ribosomal protein L27 [Spironucleus salmonicida]
MPTRNYSSRKHRGHAKQGYGRRGNHLKHAGGRGNAGGEHHRRINYTKYHPAHFGKLGMRNYHRNQAMENLEFVNTGCLWALIPEAQQDSFLKSKDANKAPVIDVTQFGYFGVRGCGALPNCPVIIKARSFTEKAEKKIKECGGVAVLVQ